MRLKGRGGVRFAWTTGSTREWCLRHSDCGTPFVAMSTTGKWTHRVVEWVTIATSTYVSTSGWYVLVTTQKKAVPIGNTIVKHVPMRVKGMGLYMTL